MTTERQSGIDLRELSTWRIGGSAASVYFPENLAELAECAQRVSESESGFFLVGLGSNLLFSTEEVNLPLIVTRGMDACEPFGESETPRSVFTQITDAAGSPEHLLYVESGAPNTRVIQRCIERGLGDLTCLTGVPGSFGGAIAMNAESVVEVMRNNMWLAEINRETGETSVTPACDHSFEYRYCSVQESILGAVLLRLHPTDSEETRRIVKERNEKRARKLPLDQPSAGCVFRNPPRDSAGALLDMAGMKEVKRGGAMYSELHANFILNVGGAASGDVVELMVLGKRAVWEKFGRSLQPEVKFVGRFDEEALEYLHSDLEESDGS